MNIAFDVDTSVVEKDKVLSLLKEKINVTKKLKVLAAVVYRWQTYIPNIYAYIN